MNLQLCLCYRMRCKDQYLAFQRFNIRVSTDIESLNEVGVTLMLFYCCILWSVAHWWLSHPQPSSVLCESTCHENLVYIPYHTTPSLHHTSCAVTIYSLCYIWYYQFFQLGYFSSGGMLSIGTNYRNMKISFFNTGTISEMTVFAYFFRMNNNSPKSEYWLGPVQLWLNYATALQIQVW